MGMSQSKQLPEQLKRSKLIIEPVKQLTGQGQKTVVVGDLNIDLWAANDPHRSYNGKKLIENKPQSLMTVTSANTTLNLINIRLTPIPSYYTISSHPYLRNVTVSRLFPVS